MADKKKEPTVEYAPEVLEQMEGDPEMAKALREFAACARQAMQGVAEGKYKSFDDAMEAITGNRPEKIDLDDFDDFEEGD